MIFSLSKILDNKNILLIVISMEMVTSCMFSILVINLNVNPYLGGFLLVFFLTLCVCESVIGLSILVKIVKKNYSETLQMFSWVKN
uniref:NADH-ubiquinone oxidoreductase chain 4L n=1 Tax=Columbicola passerinae TaxID=128994 RepID=A0A6G8QRZ3_9NEOP|nr:NADH dehydrogenase subunit 4L [Columbicola passerinae]